MLDGQRVGRVYVLARRDMLVGSDEDCAIRFHDEGVLSRHALVHCGRTPPVVADLTGCGLTRVNGRPISDAELFDGDIVFFGPQVVIRFELRGVVRCDPAARLRVDPEVAAELDRRQRDVADLYVMGERAEAIAEQIDLEVATVEEVIASLHARWPGCDRARVIERLTRSARSSRTLRR